jgi:hypothetical protein
LDVPEPTEALSTVDAATQLKDPTTAARYVEAAKAATNLAFTATMEVISHTVGSLYKPVASGSLNAAAYGDAVKPSAIQPNLTPAIPLAFVIAGANSTSVIEESRAI